ncbi:MAG TPA: CRISPR-associated RAMP protein Csx7 [Bacillota bacterium]|nr:CRISPR-associated RAMP protein Csx7 [Bacillota bacterium]
MSESLRFHRFYIIGNLKAHTALHIGAGDTDFTPGTIDNGVLRDSQGRYFIPGSSLKGVSRAYVESYAAGGYQNNCCIDGSCAETSQLHTKDKRDRLRTEFREKYHKANGKDPLDHEIEAELARQIQSKLCPVCRLFGSPVKAGQLKIRDAYPTTDPYQTELRPHVSIDRETRTNVSGRFYKDEVTPADTVFAFSAVLNQPDEDVLQYVAFWVEALRNEEITVGGMSSRGLGVVVLEDLRVKYQCGMGPGSEWKDCNGNLLRYLQDCLRERKDG